MNNPSQGTRTASLMSDRSTGRPEGDRHAVLAMSHAVDQATWGDCTRDLGEICRRAFFRGSLVFAVSMLLGASIAFARHPKVARDLEAKDPASAVDVIVQFEREPGEAQ